MFTQGQIIEKLSKVRTGADFPVLAKDLNDIGITWYETKIEDGSSVFHGEDGFSVPTGPNYAPITVADSVNLEQLKTDIASHQQGKSDYFGISRQCAASGIEKWQVDLQAMTCTYVNKAGNKVWVEHIPHPVSPTTSFTAEQLQSAHGKVKSGADFPAYIREIKALGVTHYETYVADGHIDYHGANGYTVNLPPKYGLLAVNDIVRGQDFRAGLAAHQQGETSFLTFIKMCAEFGIEKWEISMHKMTCTYYSKAGDEILVEQIPQ